MNDLNQFSAQDVLILHTEIANQYFTGNWKENKIYLVQFASIIAKLWQASKQDDPYADYFLYKIYDQIQEGLQLFETAEARMIKELNKLSGIEIKIFTNLTPFKRPLLFKTPYAFMGARLLLKLDEVLRLILTMRKLGLQEIESYTYRNLLHALHKVYVMPKRWRSTQVTRNDMVNATEKAKKAQALMGELPKPVLENALRFPFKPKTIQPSV